MKEMLFGILFVICSFVYINALYLDKLPDTISVKLGEVAQKEEYKELLTLDELEQYLGISKIDIVKLTMNKTGDGHLESKLPVLMVNNKNYYPKKAVDRWLEEIEFLEVME